MEVVRLRSPAAVSALLHAFVLVLLAMLGRQSIETAQRPQTTWIELEPVRNRSAQEDARNRIVQTRSERESAQAAEKSFLGERTQVVDRETVARGETQTPGGQARAKSQTARAPRAQSVPAMDFAKLGVGMVRPPRAQPGSESELLRERAQDSQMPGGPASEYIHGLKESEVTALNTREYVFYGYFQRIRENLDIAWNRSLRDQLTRLYRKGRKLASETDHLTRTLVTLNGAGEVVRVQVIEESGSRDLDQAAVEAFRRAGPFPNPPQGILDARGEIQIRWDFILKT